MKRTIVALGLAALASFSIAVDNKGKVHMWSQGPQGHVWYYGSQGVEWGTVLTPNYETEIENRKVPHGVDELLLHELMDREDLTWRLLYE